MGGAPPAGRTLGVSAMATAPHRTNRSARAKTATTPTGAAAVFGAAAGGDPVPGSGPAEEAIVVDLTGYIGLSEAASRLGVCRRTLDYLRARDRLTTYRHPLNGKLRLLREADLERYRRPVPLAARPAARRAGRAISA